MRPEGTPIQTLLLRTFLPAVVVVALLLAALVYNWLYTSIMDGFDRKLVTTSAMAGAMIDPSDHDGLMREAKTGADAEPIEKRRDYLRNVEPMRRIRTGLNLTYLYSQILGGGGPLSVIYVLDSSIGDDHSTIGSKDELTDETIVGLKKTQADGSIYVSPIEYQEQWGLLKTAAAPIYGSDGRITATAGADVNISLIQVATQNALFASALIGIGSILICLLVALVIVQRVARPIVALKQEALRIAAGDATEPAPIKGPREVARLRDDLASLAAQMSAAAAQSREAAARHERAANDAVLAGGEAPRAVFAAPGRADREAPPLLEPGEVPPVIDEETTRHLIALRKTAPFDTLAEGELVLVARQVRFRRFDPDAVLLPAGGVADMLFVVIEGEALTDSGPAPTLFDASSALFGLPVRSDYRAGPEGVGVLCLAKPHLFTIARECPDFVVGLATVAARRQA